ncbi:MAG: glucose-6-phosphate dehydrogenase [Nitrospirales bacterium]|nr:glucose-6-phosphate dehydrogenase [Nitrospirales bacterium]
MSVDSRFLQTCDLPLEEQRIEPFIIVIFGGAGDLSRKELLPTLYHICGENRDFAENMQVLATGRTEMTDEAYRSLILEEMGKNSEASWSTGQWEVFADCLFYLRCADDADYELLKQRLEEMRGSSSQGPLRIVFYMAVPPDAVSPVIKKLKGHGLNTASFDARIIIEKPFGRDRATARELNASLLDAFQEKQIYRIDHYLGKETVQNIIFLRFSNTLFERIWNGRYIDNVQITVAETIGIEKRGGFYEATGVVRDIVQNHMMQLVGLVAMEPPIGFEPDLIRDEQVKLFRSVMPMNDEYIDSFSVQGQYGPGRINGQYVKGYREELHVAPDSVAPTFIAAKLQIANWRWAGVPFYIRTGKRLARHVSEIAVQFRQPPLRLFGRRCDPLEPNVIVLTIQPEEKIGIRFSVKYPDSLNRVAPVNMGFSYSDAFTVQSHLAYERLILDCIKGDQTLFVRQDGVDALWEIVDPLIARWEELQGPAFPNYGAGTWGPAAAETFLQREGRRWITV